MNTRPDSSKSWASPFVKLKSEGPKSYAERKKESIITFNPDTEKFDQSLPPLIFDRLSAGCAAFKSPLHDNREVVLAVGGQYQATAEVLDYTQPNPAWTESNYSFIYCFI